MQEVHGKQSALGVRMEARQGQDDVENRRWLGSRQLSLKGHAQPRSHLTTLLAAALGSGAPKCSSMRQGLFQFDLQDQSTSAYRSD
jgi:hypothetical protein